MGDLFGVIASLSIVSQVFIVAIVAIAVLFNVRYTPRVVDLGPTILTTLGIFGTFLGVSIGLSHFDTTNVQASVPDLLAGLKTAFWASVFGVGAAVQLKAREFLGGARPAQDSEESAGDTSSPLAVLIDIRDALTGTGDFSMAGQIRLLRQDMNDRLLAQIRGARQEANERMESLREGQRELLGHMATSTEAQARALQTLASAGAATLVDALQHVVTDFNDKVAAQFGENYRDLHQAVGQLLAWQTEYRGFIQATNDQLAVTLAQLGTAAADFRGVAEGSERFALTADRVARTLDGIEAGEERMNLLARATARLTEEAAGRVPFIESRLYELTTQMTSAVQANQRALHAALTASIAESRQTLQEAHALFADIARGGAEQMQQSQQRMAEALLAMQQNLQGAVSASAGHESDRTKRPARTLHIAEK
jgi:hypothetical protein